MSRPLIHEKSLNDWIIGSIQALDDLSCLTLTGLLEPGPPKASETVTPLGGRTAVQHISLADSGDLVVKKYRRGGIMERVFKDRYLYTDSCRARSELEMLVHADRCGINVPEPVFFAQKGRWLYQCWLGTQKIPNIGTLAQLAASSPDLVQQCKDLLIRQIHRLIDHGIHHVDLHPGNVLLGTDQTVYILDFDKAALVRGNRQTLSRKYMNRWNRAVAKHRLDPDIFDLPPFY